MPHKNFHNIHSLVSTKPWKVYFLYNELGTLHITATLGIQLVLSQI